MSSYTETKNAAIYQGVLEHFQSHHPDILCVMSRKRGFFKKAFLKKCVIKKGFLDHYTIVSTVQTVVILE